MTETLNKDPTRVNSYMNRRTLAKLVATLTPEQKEELMNTTVSLSEKTDGTSFRIGFTNTGRKFIASRKQVFYLNEDNEFILEGSEKSKHPHWTKIGLKLQEQLLLLLEEIKPNGEEYIFYCELYGPSLGEKKMHYKETELFIYDIKIDNKYVTRSSFPTFEESFQAKEITIPFAPTLKTCTLKEALEIDVEKMKSTYTDDPYTEGFVIVPLLNPPTWWYDRSHDDFIIKVKQQRFKNLRTDSKRSPKKPRFQSKFADFINNKRIENVIKELTENGVNLEAEMVDLQVLIPAVIKNIERTENDDNTLDKKHRSHLHGVIAKEYLQHLEDIATKTLEQ